MNLGKFLLAVFFMAITQVLCAQNYYFRHYQVENGLSNNAVICSLQDRKGFLWFGTKDGLNRFDGYSFKIFRNDPDDSGSIGSNFVHSIFEDENGTLWVGTENGLYQYQAHTESFSRVKGIDNGQIRAIQSDKKGNLWFISGFTLCRYNINIPQLQLYDIGHYFEATSLCLSSDNSIWVSTVSGSLCKYQPGSNAFSYYDVFSHSGPVVAKWIETIYSTNNGKILIGTSNQGAKIFDIASGNYKDILTYNPDKTEIFVRNFLQVSDQECWIASENGIFIYNLSSRNVINLQKSYNDPYSISDNAVYTFCKDKEGGIWAGTYFGGVNYFPRQYTLFKKYFPKVGENSLSGNVVREIHQDKYGFLWIGTEDAGLNRLDTNTGTFKHFKPTGEAGSISYSNKHGLLLHGDELWIGTFEHGLDVMNINTGKVIRRYNMNQASNSLKSNFIYCLYESDSGHIMLGTTRGAYVYDPGKNSFNLLPGLPPNNWYSSLLKDENGIIWAGTYGNGLQYFNTNTKQAGNFLYRERDKNSISSNRINSIYEDSRHNLWFATEGGLCLFNKDQKNFKRFTSQDGLPSNFILCLLEDEQQNLWISTSKGLACYSPNNKSFTVFTKTNGLLNDQFNFNSAFKDANGRMYYGSVKGFISFNPKDFITNSYISKVYITGFQVHNKELPIGRGGSPLKNAITYTDKIILTHNQSTFSIDFSALNFTAPEMCEYAYKLEGLDKNWTYLKTNRKVFFTELAPGTYHFKVKASNSSGIWNKKETSLMIVILPPWWLSWWAYLLYILIVLALIIYIVRDYHKRTEEKNKRKIELFEIAKEKEVFRAKIEFFTQVAHEIKTPLTLIKGPLEKVIKRAADRPDLKESLRIMDRNTNRLIDLTNQLLDFRQTELQGFSLNFVRVNISEMLEELCSGFKSLADQKNLGFYIDLPANPVYAYIDQEAFQKIVSNLLSNAIKYAYSKSMVRLYPLKEGDLCFIIEIKNDGYLIPADMKEKIFEPFFRLKETEKQKGTGIGLALSRSLTLLHNGELVLEDSDGECNIFTLRLPVHQDVEFNIGPNQIGSANSKMNKS